MLQFDTLPLEDALPRVLPYVNGCPNQTAIFHLRQAAIKFMRKTLCWQAELDPVASIVGREVYAIPLPDDSSLVKILRYRLGTRYDSGLLTPGQGRDYRDLQMHAEGIWSDDRKSFHVNPLPTTAGEPMCLTVAMRPTEDAAEIPEQVFEQYIEAIAQGAISTISAIPRQSFSDMQQAVMRDEFFRREINSVAMQVSKGFASANGRVRAQFF